LALSPYPVEFHNEWPTSPVAYPTPGHSDAFTAVTSRYWCPWIGSDWARPKRRYLSAGYVSIHLYLKTTSAAFVTVDLVQYDPGTMLTVGSPIASYATGSFSNGTYQEFILGGWILGSQVWSSDIRICLDILAHTSAGTPTVNLAAYTVADGPSYSYLNWPLNLYSTD
jgi:hypothetical protein